VCFLTFFSRVLRVRRYEERILKLEEKLAGLKKFEERRDEIEVNFAEEVRPTSGTDERSQISLASGASRPRTMDWTV
jgi:hypothetical protein